MGVLNELQLPESDLELLTESDVNAFGPAITRRLKRPRADPSCRDRILRMLDGNDGPELTTFDAQREYQRTVIDPD